MLKKPFLCRRRECSGCLKDACHIARRAGFITKVTFDLYAVGSNSSALESRLLVERSALSKHNFSLLQTSNCTPEGNQQFNLQRTEIRNSRCAVLLLTTRGRAHCEELCCSSLTNRFLFLHHGPTGPFFSNPQTSRADIKRKHKMAAA